MASRTPQRGKKGRKVAGSPRPDAAAVSGENQEFMLLERRRKTAALYLEGKPQTEIAKLLEISPATVKADLDFVKGVWLRAMRDDFDARKAEELARIDKLEATAWAAWERSCRDAEIKRTKTVGMMKPVKRSKTQTRFIPNSQITETEIRGQSGDPRFLEQVEKCINLRLKLFGMLKTDKHYHTNNQLTINWTEIIGREPPGDYEDPLQARIREVEAKSGITLLPPPKPSETEDEYWRRMEAEQERRKLGLERLDVAHHPLPDGGEVTQELMDKVLYADPPKADEQETPPDSFDPLLEGEET